MHIFRHRVGALTAFSGLTVAIVTASAMGQISLELLGRHESGVFNRSAAEIAVHDPARQRLLVVNADQGRIEQLDIRDPAHPQPLPPLALPPLQARLHGGKATSVAVHGNLIAMTIEAKVRTDPGTVALFNTDGSFIAALAVGCVPDMVVFTPDGKRLLVANEGEPNDDYAVDPEGSVSVIDLSHGAASVSQSDVTTAGFSQFFKADITPGVRIYGPKATAAQDLEPEYIAVSDSRTAWLTLQENNAIAVVDVEQAVVTKLAGLGFKDHAAEHKGLDASDKDGQVRIANWPVRGMYQPDGIASFVINDEVFLITANEGDHREYAGFNETARVADLTFDPVAFPNAIDLKGIEALGRLTVSRITGDTDGDGDIDELHAFGGRSFAIWDSSLNLVYESGDQFEQITARELDSTGESGGFNADNEKTGSFDSRSDNKGPEPEGVAVGSIEGRTYAFIGLERPGGIMVYDISNPRPPHEPTFVQYVNSRDFSAANASAAGDLGPEGLLFIPSAQSPIDQPLLVVANEVSGTVCIYRITHPSPAPTGPR